MAQRKFLKIVGASVLAAGLAAVGLAAFAEGPAPVKPVAKALAPAAKATDNAVPTTAAAVVEKKIDKAHLDLPVAKINGQVITLGFIEDAAAKQSPFQRKDLLDPGKRQEFVDKLINMELLAAEAETKGYRNDPEVKSVEKNQLASLMHRRLADSITDPAPDDAALKKYYDENLSDYNKPEKMRARHILLKDQAAAKKILAEVVSKKLSQQDFRKLAQEQSEDEATKLRGGDLTFFSRPNEKEAGDPDVDPAVIEAAFKLKNNGDVAAQLVKGKNGFSIVMRTGHRDKMALAFEEAKDRLVVLVKREQRKQQLEDAVNKLKDSFKVEVFQENLKHVVIDLSSSPEGDGPGGQLAPPGMPAGAGPMAAPTPMGAGAPVPAAPAPAPAAPDQN